MRYSFFTYILFPAFILAACDTPSSDDETPPVIVGIEKPQEGDTLYLGQDDNRFTADFTDDEGISSYMVKIESALPNQKKDSLYMKYSKGWSPSVFMAKEVHAYNNIVLDDRQKPDSIIINNTTTYPVIPGDYKFKVYCMDMAGNVDSLIRNVKVIYPPEPEVPEE